AEARNLAAHGRFAQLGAAQTELPVETARPAGDCAAIAQAALARVAPQSLQLSHSSSALPPRASRLAKDLFQLRAYGGVALPQLPTLVFAIDHRCLGHNLTPAVTCGTEN